MQTQIHSNMCTIIWHTVRKKLTKDWNQVMDLRISFALMGTICRKNGLLLWSTIYSVFNCQTVLDKHIAHTKDWINHARLFYFPEIILTNCGAVLMGISLTYNHTHVLCSPVAAIQVGTGRSQWQGYRWHTGYYSLGKTFTNNVSWAHYAQSIHGEIYARLYKVIFTFKYSITFITAAAGTHVGIIKRNAT